MRDLQAYDDESRVWIYQADRPFDEVDLVAANQDIEVFCEQWTSHNRELKATGSVINDLFVLLLVDETKAPTSGCSIDKSVQFVKKLEQKYNRRLLDRGQVAYLDDQEQIHTIPLSQLKEAVQDGRLNMETKVFDNLVATRKDFDRRWVVPLGESWMKRFT